MFEIYFQVISQIRDWAVFRYTFNGKTRNFGIGHMKFHKKNQHRFETTIGSQSEIT